MTDKQEESTPRPTSECRGQGGGAQGTGEEVGGTGSQHIVTSGCCLYLYRTGGLGGGVGHEKRGKQDGVATMSRPEQ